MNRIYIHIDADAFFASVEQCIHKELTGKPVVTGRDGSIAIALSYEAKALGVERGMPTHLVTQEYPEVYMIASDYQVYRIFSDRMIRIISEYLTNVQRTSVDECKGHFPTTVSSFDEAYRQAQIIKTSLETRLGCSFSIGIGRTPLLAKIASAMDKPSGITVIDTPDQYLTLYSLSIENVPGFGRRMAPRLRGMGIATIAQFINRYTYIAHNFSAPIEKIYQELTQEVTISRMSKPLQSMNRARSFQSTTNYEELLGQLSDNTEYLLRKLRYQQLRTQKIYITLRDKERNSYTQQVRLLSASNSHSDIFKQCIRLLEKIYQCDVRYRYVSVTFSGLCPATHIQPDLFGESNTQDSNLNMWKVIDATNSKLGAAHIVTANSLLQPRNLGSHLKKKDNDKYIKRYPLLPKETAWRRIQYPYLGTIS